MARQVEHHGSKKRRFTLMLVPNDDGAGEPRSFRFAPWHVLTTFVVAFVLVVWGIIALLYYTPVGTLIPIPNPRLEEEYIRELVAINDRMASMMDEIIELKAYNVKLRNALGEDVSLTDSGIVSPASPRRQRPPLQTQRDPASSVSMNRTLEFPSVPVSQAQMQPTTDVGVRVSFPAIMPTQGYITRGFSPEDGHFGIDIAARTGSTVSAAADGYVVLAGWTHDDGNVLIVSHASGFLTFYKHNQSLLKTANSFVRRGEPIALLGNSGQTSSGPHLHFEIWKDGTPVNPALYLLNINL